MRPDDLQYLWLPLSHSFGKTVLCGVIHVGVPTYVDGRVDKLVENLAVVKPTLMCAAPRIFEKVYNRAVTTAQNGGAAKAKIFNWAVRVGKAKVTLEQAGHRVPGWLRLRYRIADKLVFRKLQTPSGRTDPDPDLRLGSAQQGHRALLRRRRPADPGGVRAHRGERGQLRQPARQAQDRHGGPSRSATWSAGSPKTARCCCGVRR